MVFSNQFLCQLFVFIANTIVHAKVLWSVQHFEKSLIENGKLGSQTEREFITMNFQLSLLHYARFM